MPTTRKQKKARKSRGLEMLSYIENLDIMLVENHFTSREREGSLNSNLPGRPRSFASNESENEDGNMGEIERNISSRTNTERDRNSITGNSSAEINRLSSELNSRNSRKMDEMMNSVSVQIQRAISDAISTQVLPQIQNIMKVGSGHGTRKGWDVPAERPELISEVQRNLNAKNNLRNEQDGNQSDNDFLGLNVHDKCIHKTDRNTLYWWSSFKTTPKDVSSAKQRDVNLTNGLESILKGHTWMAMNKRYSVDRVSCSNRITFLSHINHHENISINKRKEWFAFTKSN